MSLPSSAHGQKRKLSSALAISRNLLDDETQGQETYGFQNENASQLDHTLDQEPQITVSSMSQLNHEDLYPYVFHDHNEQVTLLAPPLPVPWNHVTQIPLDFTSILSQQYQNTTTLEYWFDKEVYSALRETGNDWSESSENLSPESILTGISTADHSNQQGSDQQSWSHTSLDRSRVLRQSLPEYVSHPRPAVEQISSPPNEASEEDAWPFAFNVKSTPILHAKPIILSDTHPLSVSHDPRFTISAKSYSKLIAFLNLDHTSGYSTGQRSTFVMPTLRVTSIFVGLFFKHFALQVPVLHLPTLDLDEDLPPSLLSVMVVIGSIYSLEQYTRRFAIVLLEKVRRSMLVNLEHDISLVRDPMTIFASLLVCHAGLWCGNKRAYMLAEMNRGAVVTYWRRAHLLEKSNGFNPNRPSSSSQPGKRTDLESNWRNWVTDESNKRLGWAVYTLDCQFPGILNLPGNAHINEFFDMGCPCDDEFWTAPTSRHWARLLGPSSEPPSVAFSSASSPFLVSLAAPSSSQHIHYTEIESKVPIHSSLSPLRLNSWTSFIVLLAIQTQIYEFSQQVLMARKSDSGDHSDEDVSEEDDPGKWTQGSAQDRTVTEGGKPGEQRKSVIDRLGERKAELLGMLYPF
jgi:hypothetical protein